MPATVVIPARYGSTRFPAKAIASATGRPLVQHVVDRVKKCGKVRDVIVATDDQRIVDALKPFDTHVVMTSDKHPSGTDRIAEVAMQLSDDIVINVQGDEPEIESEVVHSLINRLENHDEQMVTAATKFPAGLDPSDPNLVKVAIDQHGHAMYFSRSPIPHARDAGSPATHFLHLGIYGYRRDFLLKFVTWEQTPCESAEKLEQLRALENGHRIFVMLTDRPTHGIDTPEQYEQFIQRFKNQQKS